jgi:hypothetical protein
LLKDQIYTSDEYIQKNWFYQKYFYCGGNARYWTFQLAMNILLQKYSNPVIIETGCQRQKDDLGAGMSTSIFGEFCSRNNGKLITVDNSEKHLSICKECTSEWSPVIEYVQSDSIEYLQKYSGFISLLYLDSLDYPVGDQAGDIFMQQAAQYHNLNEFLAIEPYIKTLGSKPLILLDDNCLNNGGKPKILKEYLEQGGWVCLFDYQQSLWIKM